MRNTAFFVTGMGLLLVQGSLYRVLSWVNVPGLLPSLVLPLILFMGVHEYSLWRGAGVTFVLGYATDLLGVAPVGLYTFTYVATFVLTRAAGVRLAAQTILMQVALALAAALVHSVMVLGLIAVFGKDAYVPRAIYPLALPHALATAAVAPLIFKLARRLHSSTVGSPHADTAVARR
jgi:rod shape-determining protein MreD